MHLTLGACVATSERHGFMRIGAGSRWSTAARSHTGLAAGSRLNAASANRTTQASSDRAGCSRAHRSFVFGSTTRRWRLQRSDNVADGSNKCLLWASMRSWGREKTEKPMPQSTAERGQPHANERVIIAMMTKGGTAMWCSTGHSARHMRTTSHAAVSIRRTLLFWSVTALIVSEKSRRERPSWYIERPRRARQ